jgi:hypothetical protein
MRRRNKQVLMMLPIGVGIGLLVGIALLALTGCKAPAPVATSVAPPAPAAPAVPAATVKIENPQITQTSDSKTIRLTVFSCPKGFEYLGSTKVAGPAQEGPNVQHMWMRQDADGTAVYAVCVKPAPARANKPTHTTIPEAATTNPK